MDKMANGIEKLLIDTQPPTLREFALERLRDAIIAGLFEPSQRLVERVLCEQLGVSRSVIREVIRHLQAEGLVDTLPNKGPIVASIDWNDARQIYDIRSALESSAVADCARIADEATKKKLRKIMTQLLHASKLGKPTETLAATTDFYREIFLSSGHVIAWEIVNRLNSRISRLRVMTLSTADRLQEGPSLIEKIFEGIERNDAAAAEEACRNHVASASKIAEMLLNQDS